MLAALKRIAARVKEAPGIRTVIAVQKRYGEDQAGLLASSITYHGFLSLFPLMLVALSVAGFVLQDFEARRSFTEDMASAVPGLRTLLGDSLDALVRNRRATGIVGLGGLLWTGLGIVRAAGASLGRVYKVDELRSPVRTVAWAVTSLVTLGALFMASVVIHGTVGSFNARGALGVVATAGGFAVGVFLDIVLMLVSYRLLTQRHGPEIRTLIRGAVFAGVGWSLLKIVGGWYASRQLGRAEAVYGTFGTTVGLLVMLSLGARLFLYGAEINMVMTEGKRAQARDAQARAA